MQKLTNAGENLVNNVASRYGLSYDAVVHMLVAVNNGGGSMAQFNSPELGGSGQWMQGGMTMVGDMFNSGLKNTVDNLCNELSDILANNQVFPVVPAGTRGSNQWWPADLGSPFSSGGQNDIRYAVFPNRLAVELNGQVSVYDTLDHNISGVSQQQGGNTSLTFSSQFGEISVTSLPLVSGQSQETPQNNFAEPPVEQQNNTQQQIPEPADTSYNQPESGNTAGKYSTNETLEIIEKLAGLRDLGVLTEEEYNVKKADLLQRL